MHVMFFLTPMQQRSRRKKSRYERPASSSSPTPTLWVRTSKVGQIELCMIYILLQIVTYSSIGYKNSSIFKASCNSTKQQTTKQNRKTVRRLNERELRSYRRWPSLTHCEHNEKHLPFSYSHSGMHKIHLGRDIFLHVLLVRW